MGIQWNEEAGAQAPAETQTQTPETVSKTRFDGIVRAKAQLEAKLDEFKAKFEKLEEAGLTDAEKVKLRLEKGELKIKTLEEQLKSKDATIRSAVLKAHLGDAHDPDAVLKLLPADIQIEGLKIGKEGEEALKKFRKDNAWAFKSGPVSGSAPAPGGKPDLGDVAKKYQEAIIKGDSEQARKFAEAIQANR